jgi:hypothetical protein
MLCLCVWHPDSALEIHKFRSCSTSDYISSEMFAQDFDKKRSLDVPRKTHPIFFNCHLNGERQVHSSLLFKHGCSLVMLSFLVSLSGFILFHRNWFRCANLVYFAGCNL